MALTAFSGLLSPGGPPDYNAWVLSEVAAGQALDWSEGFLFQVVAGMFPAYSTDQVAEAIELGRAQLAAAVAFGTPDVYHRPRLADIPICPGCPAGRIEVRQRVQVFDPTTGLPIVEGFISCIYSSIPDQADLQECADSWAEQMIEAHYPSAGGFQAIGEVASAQRGAFFGR